jgi:putative transposase
LDQSSSFAATPINAFIAESSKIAQGPSIVMHDNGVQFGPEFRETLRMCGAQPQRLQFRAPNLNAHVERFIQTLQQECLDHFMILGAKHLDHLVREFVRHYHEERPHQSMGNAPLRRSNSEQRDGPIRCRTRLGGVLRHYYRIAA